MSEIDERQKEWEAAQMLLQPAQQALALAEMRIAELFSERRKTLKAIRSNSKEGKDAERRISESFEREIEQAKKERDKHHRRLYSAPHRYKNGLFMHVVKPFYEIIKNHLKQDFIFNPTAVKFSARHSDEESSSKFFAELRRLWRRLRPRLLQRYRQSRVKGKSRKTQRAAFRAGFKRRQRLLNQWAVSHDKSRTYERFLNDRMVRHALNRFSVHIHHAFCQRPYYDPYLFCRNSPDEVSEYEKKVSGVIRDLFVRIHAPGTQFYETEGQREEARLAYNRILENATLDNILANANPLSPAYLCHLINYPPYRTAKKYFDELLRKTGVSHPSHAPQK